MRWQLENWRFSEFVNIKESDLKLGDGPDIYNRVMIVDTLKEMEKGVMAMISLQEYIYTYYKTKSSAASVCLSVCLRAKNSKTTARIFMGFSPIDRAILPENSDI